MAEVKDYSAEALLAKEKEVELDTDDVKEESIELEQKEENMTALIKIIDLAKELDSFFALNSDIFDPKTTKLCQNELILELKQRLENQNIANQDLTKKAQSTIDGSFVRNLKISVMSILQM